MRWQKKRWSSNSTLRSTDNSGILQCFRGTTVCVASGGLDMHVPEPFLQMKQSFWLWRTHPSSGYKRSLLSSRSGYTRARLTWYEIAPRWPGSWLSGCRCWPSPVHCSVEVCSTWYGSPLSFRQPSQTHPRLTSPQLCVSFEDPSPCSRACLQQDSRSDTLWRGGLSWNIQQISNNIYRLMGVNDLNQAVICIM